MVVVPWMPHFLISAPVRGGVHIEAVEPYSTQILRATRSVHFAFGVLCTMLSSPRTSTRLIGQGARPPIAVEVICPSG